MIGCLCVLLLVLIVTVISEPFGQFCPKENGFCIKSNGVDQNEGVIKLNDVDINTPELQAACLSKCRGISGATGCETIWNQENRGCYAHTSVIAKGNDFINHACWVFSKCTTDSPPSKYYKMPGANHCPDSFTIHTVEDCRMASLALSIPFNGEVTTLQDQRPQGCFWDRNGYSYFNNNSTATNLWGGVGGICHAAYRLKSCSANPLQGTPIQSFQTASAAVEACKNVAGCYGYQDRNCDGVFQQDGNDFFLCGQPDTWSASQNSCIYGKGTDLTSLLAEILTTNTQSYDKKKRKANNRRNSRN